VAFGLVIASSAMALRIARAANGRRRLLAVRIEHSPDGPASNIHSPGGQSASGQVTSRPILAGLVPEVFVAPAGAVSLDGPLPAASLHLPLTLARIMTQPQLRALAVRAETRAAQDGGAVNRVVESWAAVGAEYAAMRRASGLRRLLALPMLSVLTLLLEGCSDAEAALERQQQLAADRAAADACGPETCGVAILKAAAFGPAWVAVVHEMREAAWDGSQYANASELFAAIVAANADLARLAAVIHPDAATPITAVTLRQRIERLGLVPEDHAAQALDIQPPEPAMAPGAADLSAVEERLTTVAHLQLLHARGPL
jgi:hypothetical protein